MKRHSIGMMRARYLFGDATGDPVADRVLEALRAHPAGSTRTEIRDILERNKNAERLRQALVLLRQTGLARRATEETGGRQAESWFAR